MPNFALKVDMLHPIECVVVLQCRAYLLLRYMADSMAWIDVLVVLCKWTSSLVSLSNSFENIGSKLMGHFSGFPG